MPLSKVTRNGKAPNKSLKDAPLDVSNRRMLRIVRAACSRPLASRYAVKVAAFMDISY